MTDAPSWAALSSAILQALSKCATLEVASVSYQTALCSVLNLYRTRSHVPVVQILHTHSRPSAQCSGQISYISAMFGSNLVHQRNVRVKSRISAQCSGQISYISAMLGLNVMESVADPAAAILAGDDCCGCTIKFCALGCNMYGRVIF